MALDQVLIAAAGDAQRFAGFDKSQLVVDGETLLGRLWTQLKFLRIDPIIVSRPAVFYDTLVSRHHPASLREYDVDKFLSSASLWQGRTALLFSDVWFSDEAIRTIVEDRDPHTIVWYGRKGPGLVKPVPELFGVTFRAVDGHAGIFTEACWECRFQYRRELRASCRGWDVYELINGRCSEVQGFVSVEDETDDFDSPEEYVAWLQATGRTGGEF